MMTDKSACKYWDCGWCYAPNYLKTNAINSTCVNPYECPISPLSEPVQYETTMTDMKTKAQEVLYAYMDVERDLSQPKILIHTLKELINQLQVSPGIIKCPDIIELCEELKNL